MGFLRGGPSGEDRGFVSQVLMFLVVSVLAGVLVAGLAVPFAGMFGLTAKSATDTFESLPGELQTPPPPERSTMYAADGSVLATFFDQNRVTVPLEEISPVMQKAVIAIEDSRFYQHGPMDAKGTVRAFVRNSQAGETSQGGSTITQQYVKLVRQQVADTPKERREVLEESYGRKLEELRYAVALEKKMSKKEILRNYLNLVFFGSSSYGVEAAAKRYFNTSASELSLTQSAMLAAMVRNPSGMNPRSNPEAVKERRDLVLDRMADLKMISLTKAEKAKKQPLGLKYQNTQNGCYTAYAQFFCDYAWNWLLDDPALGKTRDDRERYLLEGGLKIRTTLDLKSQKSTSKAVQQRARKTDEPVAAVSMVEPGTGHVKAMAQSKPMGTDKGESFINFNVPQKYNGGIGFQPGSSFKPFVLAAAIHQGISLTRSYPSPESMVQTGSVKNCKGAVTDDWPVSNSTSAGSSSTLITGTTGSVNTFYANLEADTGICEPWKIANKLGAKRADGGELGQYKSFVLGVNEVAPISMAEAYATFAARGKHCDATPVTGVTDRRGNSVGIRGSNCTQAVPKDVADGVNYVLKKVVDGSVSGATGTDMQLDDGRDTAGKTGTNDSNKAVWFMGYTPDIATASVVATPNNKSLNGLSIGGETTFSAYGGTVAGPMWKAAMQGALENTKKTEFKSPDSNSTSGVATDVPYVVGTSSSRARDQLEQASFNVIYGGYVDSSYPYGTVARQDPGGGWRSPSGSSVTIYLSNGNGGSDDEDDNNDDDSNNDDNDNDNNEDNEDNDNNNDQDDQNDNNNQNNNGPAERSTDKPDLPHNTNHG